MDSYTYHMTKWDPQPIVDGSWARVHPDPLNYNISLRLTWPKVQKNAQIHYELEGQ